MTVPLGDDIRSVSQDGQLRSLSRGRIALIILASIGRTLLGLLLIGWMMTLVPDEPGGSLAVPVLMAILITAGYALFFRRQIRGVYRARYPMVRAGEALVMVASMFLALFAVAYVILSQRSPGAFTEQLDPFSAYYFSLTVLATVGFGDITPVSTVARAITMVQMSLDIAFIAVVIRVIGGAAKKAVTQRDDRAGADRL